MLRECRFAKMTPRYLNSCEHASAPAHCVLPHADRDRESNLKMVHEDKLNITTRDFKTLASRLDLPLRFVQNFLSRHQEIPLHYGTPLVSCHKPSDSIRGNISFLPSYWHL